MEFAREFGREAKPYLIFLASLLLAGAAAELAATRLSAAVCAAVLVFAGFCLAMRAVVDD